MTTIASVPDLPTATQLPLFESIRPSRFQLTLTGNVELSLADADEAALATGMKLGEEYTVVIHPTQRPEEEVMFVASVTKRVHKKVRHAEHGDAVVSAAVLTVTGLEAGE